MEEEIMTHTGSTVTAKETLAMESGKDLNITGSKAGGKKVEVKTGNNLSIESLQDSHTYHSRDKESGIHLQRDITARPDTGKKKMDDPYFSIGKKTDTTDSTYISVTKQAGIYAGKEGYDIQVKNNTRLKGAVIDSQAPAEKNKLTTGTLTWENIENKAEYKTGGHGISYNGKIGRGDKNDPLDSRTNNRYGKDIITGQRNGMNKITPTIYGSKIPLNERGILNTPIPSVKGKAGTTTTSAVSKGTLTITDKENQKQDIEKLNRNTENSLNKLKEIFDKTKVEERKRLLEELGIVGNRAIHEIASHNGWKDGSTEKGSPPWHAGSHHKRQERRKRAKRPDSRGSQRICHRVLKTDQRERLDKQASRYSAEHLSRLWGNPVQDDRRKRTYRRLHLPDGNEVE